MFRNSRFKNTCLFFIMGWIPLLGSCSQTMEPTLNTAAASEEPSVNVERRAAPIDAAVPARFETASFGLG